MSASLPNELRLVADMIIYIGELERRCRMSTGEAASGMMLITPDDARRLNLVGKSLVRLEASSPDILRALDRSRRK